jgi:glycerol 3-phosphatase-2
MPDAMPGHDDRPEGPPHPDPAAPLAAGYRVVVFDCDGVMYLGDQVIPAAPGAVKGVRELGGHVGFVTNMSSTGPADVATKLTRLGIQAEPGDVITSAQAAVRMLGGPDALAGIKTMVIGGPGLRDELTGAGAHVLGPGRWREAELVVVGFDPELTFAKLADASLALAVAGARFAATNADPSLPGPDGPLPGAGSLLALLTTATGRRPEVAGKPAPALFETTAARLGDGPYLMVGDRADTDLAGAAGLGWDTALVLSGAVQPADLPDVPVLPTWVLPHAGGLLVPAPPAVRLPGRDELEAAGRLLDEAGPEADQLRPETTAVAVVADGRVVGAVAWSAGDGEGDGGPGQLHGPVVEPDARCALVGTRLVMAACAGLRAAGAAAVRATGAGMAVSRFLTRLGFAPDSGDPDILTRELREPSRL